MIRSRIRARDVLTDGGESQRGSVTLEGSIVFSALVLLFGVGLHFGILFHGNNTAHQAAMIAMQELRLADGSDAAAVAAAHSYLDGGAVEGAWVEVSKGPERTTVTVTGTTNTFLPGLENQISETVVGPTERWVG